MAYRSIGVAGSILLVLAGAAWAGPRPGTAGGGAVLSAPAARVETGGIALEFRVEGSAIVVEPRTLDGRPLGVAGVRFSGRIAGLPGARGELGFAIEVPAAGTEDYPLRTCVVSGELLGGSMGPPFDHRHQGRLVRFCCEACVERFAKDPARYLAMIDQARRRLAAPRPRAP